MEAEIGVLIFYKSKEEINRRIIDHISDINLPYTTIARDYLLREGLPPIKLSRQEALLLKF